MIASADGDGFHGTPTADGASHANEHLRIATFLSHQGVAGNGSSSNRPAQLLGLTRSAKAWRAPDAAGVTNPVEVDVTSFNFGPHRSARTDVRRLCRRHDQAHRLRLEVRRSAISDDVKLAATIGLEPIPIERQAFSAEHRLDHLVRARRSWVRPKRLTISPRLFTTKWVGRQLQRPPTVATAPCCQSHLNAACASSCS